MKQCLVCNKKIKEVKKRQTPDFCSDECAYETISKEGHVPPMNHYCFSDIVERKTATQLYPSLLEDVDANGGLSNAIKAMEE